MDEKDENDFIPVTKKKGKKTVLPLTPPREPVQVVKVNESVESVKGGEAVESVEVNESVESVNGGEPVLKETVDVHQINVEENNQELDQNNEDADDSSDGEWITPASLAKKKELQRPKDLNLSVACITSDFAMQNVLLQMKLALVTVDGLHITHIKNWVLRCHACYK